LRLCLLPALTMLAACASLERGPPPKPETQPYVPQNIPPSKSFIGKGEGDLVQLLGNPSLVRREKGVEVFQYAPGTCTLLFYLYKDAVGVRRVTYLEAVPAGANVSDPSSVTPDSCLADQIRAQAASARPSS
jgi:hypothetical protein